MRSAADSLHRQLPAGGGSNDKSAVFIHLKVIPGRHSLLTATERMPAPYCRAGDARHGGLPHALQQPPARLSRDIFEQEFELAAYQGDAGGQLAALRKCVALSSVAADTLLEMCEMSRGEDQLPSQAAQNQK